MLVKEAVRWEAASWIENLKQEGSAPTMAVVETRMEVVHEQNVLRSIVVALVDIPWGFAVLVAGQRRHDVPSALQFAREQIPSFLFAHEAAWDPRVRHVTGTNHSETDPLGILEHHEGCCRMNSDCEECCSSLKGRCKHEEQQSRERNEGERLRPWRAKRVDEIPFHQVLYLQDST